MPETKHIIVSKKDLRKGLNLNGFFGNIASGLLMSVLSINRLNRVYNKLYHEDAKEFSRRIIERKNNKLTVCENDIKLIPEKGPFVILFNHPYGGIDAVAITETLLSVRPDTKFIANFLLTKIEPMAPYLFKVNPFETRKSAFSSLSGLKEMYKHLENGHPVCILPAGEVSTKYNGSNVVEDREWQANTMKLIKAYDVPIVSAYISGKNSRLFHLLGKIHPVLRTAMLPRELLVMKNNHFYIRFSGHSGNKVLKLIEKTKELASILRSKTYLLRDDTVLQDKKHIDPPHYQEIITETGLSKIKEDIRVLSEKNLLFQTDNYQCFFADTEQIPNVFREISRLRELTFRTVGEGTGREFDLDEFDNYYKHLFIWDEDAERVVGAYRIGMGADILSTKGKNGFYINSLFDLKEDFDNYLSHSMEMGRSFIVPDYQRKTLPLFLLWKGIYHVTQKYPDYKYLIGPASISNLYSENAKILMIEYLKKNHIWKELTSMVKCRKPYNYELSPHHQKILDVFGDELSHMDRFIKDIDINHYGIPVLIKKYLSLGGRIVDFNVDPDFNYSIDGFVVLDIDVVSEEVIKSYNK